LPAFSVNQENFLSPEEEEDSFVDNAVIEVGIFGGHMNHHAVGQMVLHRILGYLLLGCPIKSVSFIICTLSLLLMPLADLHFCGLDFVPPSL
jgi:hypothetical protein